MTIGFSKNWSHHSWHTSQRLDVENEQLLIIEMIKHCDNQTVKLYAFDEQEFGVYVRTGLHSSKSEARDHVQVVLGSNDPEKWKHENANAGYTGHIIYHDPAGQQTKPYEAILYDSQHHLKRVGKA